MLTIKQRHEMQQDIAIYNTLSNRKVATYWNTRKVLARNIREARKLRDSELRRIAATLPA